MKKTTRAFFILITACVCFAACHGVSHTKGGDDGYYYSIVSDAPRKEAQFSSVYYSDCDKQRIMDSTKSYGMNHNFSDYKVQGPFSSTADADADKTEVKGNYRDSGFNIDGDNNFFGDCKK